MIIADGDVPYFTIGALRDQQKGDLPPTIEIEGHTVTVTKGGAGRGFKQFLVCPRCRKAREILIMPDWDREPACRTCHDVDGFFEPHFDMDEDP